MNIIQRFDELCIDNDSDASSGLNRAAKLISIYAFYHYFNGDVSQLEEISNNLCYYDPEDWFLSAVFRSATIDGNAVDFITTVDRDVLGSVSEAELKDLIQKEALAIGKVVYHDKDAKAKVRLVYDQLGLKVIDDESAFFTLKVLCDWAPEPEEKIRLQAIVASCGVKNNKVAFELIFADDIEQEIDDIESPKEYVSSGTLNVFGDASSCRIGAEGSFITIISAKSLKMLFFQYATRGLFASNLRFFISAKKIDPKIIDTIQNDSENFVYYNNGIIITCDECYRVANQLRFTNFSIVNGGQTTNLIGRTPFEADFGVVCKVITSKYEDRVRKVEFLSKVAEASNTQKPINAKDLIANRKEQRFLKEQYSHCGVFLKVKRGEKINKSLFPEPWQSASNDEMAQIIYSMVYQMPGAAKNSKAALLSNEKTYDLIFTPNYADEFLVSIQHLKVAFAKWKKDLLKKEMKSSIKYGLARTGDLLSFAVIGLIEKLLTNEALAKRMIAYPISSLNNENEDMKFMLLQNDIGSMSIINPLVLDLIDKDTFHAVFDLVFDSILVPAYKRFKSQYPNYAYGNFSKTQTYYFRYVLPVAVDFIFKFEPKIKQTIGPLLNFAADSSVGFREKREFDKYRPGLEEELKEFRAKKVNSSNGRLTTNEVFTHLQLATICRVLPHTKIHLELKCNFKERQVEEFGDDILRIVAKYCDLSDFEEGENNSGD